VKKTIWSIHFLLLFLTLFSPVASAANPVGQFQVVLADAKWDGKTIPYGQQCLRDGGKGSTPALSLKNIPAEANAIVFEYSDATYSPMNNGGHGKIGYSIAPGTSEVNVPPLLGNTLTVPDGFFIISPHSNPSWDKAGAYLPPCSGGRGNSYYVTVKAVVLPPDKLQKIKVLGTLKINLGNY
jgi:hypothetical protein